MDGLQDNFEMFLAEAFDDIANNHDASKHC